MACFTKTQQRNGTNCEFEKYVTMNNFFMLNSLDKSHLNSICTQYVCDKSENARVCAKWQWYARDWCYWIAVQSSNTVSCVSLSFRTHPCVLAIKPPVCTVQDVNPFCAEHTPFAKSNGRFFSDRKTNMMPSSNLYDFWRVHKIHASVHFLIKIYWLLALTRSAPGF